MPAPKIYHWHLLKGRVKKNEATEKYWVWFIGCVTIPYTCYMRLEEPKILYMQPILPCVSLEVMACTKLH